MHREKHGINDDCRVGYAATKQRLENAAREAQALRQDSQSKGPAAAKRRKVIDERAKKMDALQKRIHDIEDRIFAAFSKKVRPLPRKIVRLSAVSCCSASFCRVCGITVGFRVDKHMWRAGRCGEYQRVHGAECGGNRGIHQAPYGPHIPGTDPSIYLKVPTPHNEPGNFFAEYLSVATERCEGSSTTRSCCALHAQATKLKHQLSYEHRRDLAADVAVAKEELKKVADNLEQLEEQARAAAEAADSVEQELAAEVCAATGSPSNTFCSRLCQGSCTAGRALRTEYC